MYGVSTKHVHCDPQVIFIFSQAAGPRPGHHIALRRPSYPGVCTTDCRLAYHEGILHLQWISIYFRVMCNEKTGALTKVVTAQP
jgi:hypothetical protein